MPRRPNAHHEEVHPWYSDKQGIICIHLHKSDKWAKRSDIFVRYQCFLCLEGCVHTLYNPTFQIKTLQIFN